MIGNAWGGRGLILGLFKTLIANSILVGIGQNQEHYQSVGLSEQKADLVQAVVIQSDHH